MARAVVRVARQPLVDAERFAREKPVEALRRVGGGFEQRSDGPRPAAHLLRAGGPVIAGGRKLALLRAGSDLAEGRGRGIAIVEAPGRQAGNPG